MGNGCTVPRAAVNGMEVAQFSSAKRQHNAPSAQSLATLQNTIPYFFHTIPGY